jgi:hypothetical protein
MSTVYAIWLEPLPQTKDAEYVDGGWYGPVFDVVQNTYLYFRVRSKQDAFKLSREEAIRIVTDMRRIGYGARCDPPVIAQY